jgi:hypothetical protein
LNPQFQAPGSEPGFSAAKLKLETFPACARLSVLFIIHRVHVSHEAPGKVFITVTILIPPFDAEAARG